MSDSVWPHRRQPTRLPCPSDSPGKNAGVGCHFLLQCVKVKNESEVSRSCPTLSDTMDCSLPGSSIHGIFQARVLEWGAIAFSDSNINQFFFFTSLNANKTMIVQFCDLTSQCVIISTLNIYDCFSVFFCLVTHSFKSYFMIKFTFLRTESICGIILLTFNLLGCFQLINCKQICALVFYRRHDIS